MLCIAKILFTHMWFQYPVPLKCRWLPHHKSTSPYKNPPFAIKLTWVDWLFIFGWRRKREEKCMELCVVKKGRQKYLNNNSHGQIIPQLSEWSLLDKIMKKKLYIHLSIKKNGQERKIADSFLSLTPLMEIEIPFSWQVRWWTTC